MENRRSSLRYILVILLSLSIGGSVLANSNDIFTRSMSSKSVVIQGTPVGSKASNASGALTTTSPQAQSSSNKNVSAQKRWIKKVV